MKSMKIAPYGLNDTMCFTNRAGLPSNVLQHIRKQVHDYAHHPVTLHCSLVNFYVHCSITHHSGLEVAINIALVGDDVKNR